MNTLVSTARSRIVPVLKMPAELALPSLRVLCSKADPEQRRATLVALRPGVRERNFLFAYVLPSLTELGLFEGTLKSGGPTRIGETIAMAANAKATSLMGRQLLKLDADKVGFVDWLLELGPRGEFKRKAPSRFVEQASPGAAAPRTIDRLRKWAAYLVFFGVVRERNVGSGTRWSVDRRHVATLRSDKPLNDAAPEFSREMRRDALLESYSRTSQQSGTRLYLPIAAIRDELGREFERRGAMLLDPEVDKIIVDAAELLPDYLVSFSPFSGPARGGIQLKNMYAGFISIRKRPSQSDDSVLKSGSSPRRANV